MPLTAVDRPEKRSGTCALAYEAVNAKIRLHLSLLAVPQRERKREREVNICCSYVEPFSFAFVHASAEW